MDQPFCFAGTRRPSQKIRSYARRTIPIVIVLAGIVDRGILVCGTGLGMAITANKVPGIFAASVTDVNTARLARERNAVQIITLGANILGCEAATTIVDAWLSAEFQGGQSTRKVAKIRELEGRYHLQGVPNLVLR